MSSRRFAAAAALVTHVVLPVLLAVPAAAQAPAPAARVLPYPIDLPPDVLGAIAAGTRTTTGRPGPNYWTNYAHYELELHLDVDKKRVTGKARIVYENRSPDTLDRLVLHAYQDLMKPDAQRTRVVVPTAGFELAAMRVDGQDVHPVVRDTRMTVRLQQPLQPHRTATVEVEWAYDVPKAGTAPRTGYENSDVFYLSYWYPQFAVYDDIDGWVADPYRGNGEFYMDYADYDLAIDVPQGYVVRATGVLQNGAEVLTGKALDALDRARETRDVVHVVDQDDLKNGTATATSPTGRLTWRFHAENVRDAAVSVGRTYLWDATHAVIKDKHGPGQDGIAEIHAVYEANAGDWVRGAEYARHTIEFMSAHVHPYPWPHMTACEGIIGGGMEFPMMTIIGGRQPAGTIAHELIHMWFPMLVGSNEKRYAWQDEGFTSFWTTLCRDDFNGRTNGPSSDVMRAANAIARGGDVSCMRHADAYGGDNFAFGAYSKPAAVLHQLRAMLGDDVFFAAFRRYAADWAFKHPLPYDFFRTFSDVAKTDLDPYFRMWLYETWPLDHAIDAVRIDGGETVVTIADKGRVMHPCVVEATFADGSKQRQTVPMADWRDRTSATLRFRGSATEVVIDPDAGTIDVDRANNRWTAK
ncbi:MAG: M1 family metallopeptidase [Planctomycetota bacterium]